MSETEPLDPRRRLRELLLIPASQRTDAEWDEINELEIRQAPGNREPRQQGEPGRREVQESAPKPPGRRSFRKPKRAPLPPRKP